MANEVSDRLRKIRMAVAGRLLVTHDLIDYLRSEFGIILDDDKIAATGVQDG